MPRRILIGLAKGLALGTLIGALFHFGLGWRVTEGLLGYLIAMGSGATAGIVAGRPPWLHEAWLESLLKSVFGLAVGAAAYWVAVRYLAADVPFSVFGAPESRSWTSLPLLYAPPVAALFGLFVELDNGIATGGSKKPGSERTDSPKPTAKPASAGSNTP